jgi:hypothetical protein
MEGILPKLPWALASPGLRVPYLATANYQPPDISFEKFPWQNGFPSTDDADGLNGKTIRSLATFLQSLLFFELLSAFLKRPNPINREDFVADGFIHLDQKSAHNHFRAWKADFSKLSHSQKQKTQEDINGLINVALWKSDIFEEAVDRLKANNEDFDRVALSVKLLISLLRSILDDTLSTVGSRFHGHYLDSWAPYVWKFIRGDEEVVYIHPLRKMGNEKARKYLAVQPKSLVPLPPSDNNGGRAARCPFGRLVVNGWCPYRAIQVCRSYDYLIVNSLASLRRNQTSLEDHRRCIQSKRCCAHDLRIDPPTSYPLRHVGHTNCSLVGVPREEIAKVIRSGRIPLISMSLEGRDLDLKVVPCTLYITYTAISHVWSDGLGNPASNALPLCQLFRLRDMIYKTYYRRYSPFYDGRNYWTRQKSNNYWYFWNMFRAGKPYSATSQKRIYFWMDTLCIPVSLDSQADEDRDLKFRAMKHITPIYAGAFNTLVLDRGIQDTNTTVRNQVAGDEFAALILRSKWMQRGWTLEEGSLAQTCVFQLMGMPYEMSSSLWSLFPIAKWHHSPLKRAFINVRQLMPLL